MPCNGTANRLVTELARGSMPPPLAHAGSELAADKKGGGIRCETF